ncbi:MAG TPA: DUF1059 domain-containing protein [Candidatus Acidoferrales bacterium]|nr:DUF1059 domain-containing protein [Candidatus Acidoferrales bacterium]
MNCSCGQLIEGENQEELFKAVRAHADEVHRDMEMSDEQIRALISAKAHAA